MASNLNCRSNIAFIQNSILSDNQKKQKKWEPSSLFSPTERYTSNFVWEIDSRPKHLIMDSYCLVTERTLAQKNNISYLLLFWKLISSALE